MVLNVMRMFEKGELKHQTIPKGVGNLVCKASMFRHIRNLPIIDQKDLLKQVIEKKLSLKEFSAEASNVKKIRIVQKCMIECLGESSWEDVELK